MKYFNPILQKVNRIDCFFGVTFRLGIFNISFAKYQALICTLVLPKPETKS